MGDGQPGPWDGSGRRQGEAAMVTTMKRGGIRGDNNNSGVVLGRQRDDGAQWLRWKAGTGRPGGAASEVMGDRGRVLRRAACHLLGVWQLGGGAAQMGSAAEDQRTAHGRFPGGQCLVRQPANLIFGTARSRSLTVTKNNTNHCEQHCPSPAFRQQFRDPSLPRPPAPQHPLPAACPPSVARQPSIVRRAR